MLESKRDAYHVAKARLAWERFQTEVRISRLTVGVSQSRAWFRGVKGEHDLIPHLFRVPHCSRRSCGQTLFRAHRDDIPKAHRIASLGRFVAVINSRNKKLETAIKEEYAAPSRSARFLSLLQSKKRIRRLLKWAGDEFPKLLDDLSQRAQLVSVDVEREAFDEYRVLSGCQHGSTWETLAEMRHYGVPTRLLDWSPSFDTALYFAVIDLQSIYHKYDCKSFTDFLNHFQAEIGIRCSSLRALVRKVDRIWSQDNEPRKCRVRQNPVIWVFNPIKACKYERHLRRESDKPGRIYEFSHDGGLDYYGTFFSSNGQWPFLLPVPMYSPWRSHRLAAQQAAFTVHGRIPAPMNYLYPEDVLSPVRIEPLAALYGVQYLREQGVDGFTIFRDLDSLGRRIKREFFGADVP